MLWFNFILGLNFIFLSFLVWLCMIMNFKQRETKFKLRIKLNCNRYIVKERCFSYHAAVICELSTTRSKQEI